MTNMTHPPQEILIKVMCSERLPKVSGEYNTNKGKVVFDDRVDAWLYIYGVTYWYEPATRVVLTVEEWETLQNKINLLAADNGRLMAKHYNP